MILAKEINDSEKEITLREFGVMVVCLITDAGLVLC